MKSLRRALPVSCFALLWIGGCEGTDTVFDPAQPETATLVVEPGSAGVTVGESINFQAAFLGEGSPGQPQGTIAWLSSDQSVATVDADGRGTGVAPGQVSITASAGEILSRPALLSVVADTSVVASVVVRPASATVAPGASHQFTAIATNAVGGVIQGTSFSWSSSDPAVASISAAGVATGLRPGQVEIRASADGISSLPARLDVVGLTRTGTFTSNPRTSYHVGGTARLSSTAGGLELHLGADFTSSSGPGLHVFLSSSQGVGSGSLDLGTLRQTSGAQIYAVPSGIGLSDFDWVVIHCVPFNVTFGYALLGAAQ
jgi:hypothetical protein